MYRQKRQLAWLLYTTRWTVCKGLKSKVLAYTPLPTCLRNCIDRYYGFYLACAFKLSFQQIDREPISKETFSIEKEKGFEWLNSLGIQWISAWQNYCNGNRCQNFIGFFYYKSTWKKCAYLSFNESLRLITFLSFWPFCLGSSRLGQVVVQSGEDW